MTETRFRIGVSARRAVVLQAAIREARDHGLHAVTHGAIAKRCTIATSKPTVLHHFPTKADIWRAVRDESGDADLIEQARVLLGDDTL